MNLGNSQSTKDEESKGETKKVIKTQFLNSSLLVCYEKEKLEQKKGMQVFIAKRRVVFKYQTHPCDLKTEPRVRKFAVKST